MAPSVQSPTVSVIVTVFRRTAFLREALASALEQTLPASEIIVADDSASAEIRAICESFASPVLRYRPNASPVGVARNIAETAAETRGEYLAILNDDDVWEPDFLATLLPVFAADTGSVLSFSDHWIIDETGKIDEAATEENSLLFGRKDLPAGKVADPADLVLRKNGVPLAMASVFCREAIDWKQYRLKAGGAYDFWISCCLAASGRSFHYTPRRLTRYRRHAAMESVRQSADKNEDAIFIYRTLLANGVFPAWRSHLRGELARALRTAGRYRLHAGQRASARARFGESFRIRPSSKALVGWLITCLSRK
jgi:glycosyltransferase involved in cell wall biosynthesis